MKTGDIITINDITYTIDLIGPRTTLLIRADGAVVHADTALLRHHLEGKA